MTQNNPLKMKNVYATILRKHTVTVTKQQINKNRGAPMHANAENKAKRLNSIKATVK